MPTSLVESVVQQAPTPAHLSGIADIGERFASERRGPPPCTTSVPMDRRRERAPLTVAARGRRPGESAFTSNAISVCGVDPVEASDWSRRCRRDPPQPPEFSHEEVHRSRCAEGDVVGIGQPARARSGRFSAGFGIGTDLRSGSSSRRDHQPAVSIV
jgi:hypothetical protein